MMQPLGQESQSVVEGLLVVGGKKGWRDSEKKGMDRLNGGIASRTLIT